MYSSSSKICTRLGLDAFTPACSKLDVRNHGGKAIRWASVNSSRFMGLMSSSIKIRHTCMTFSSAAHGPQSITHNSTHSTTHGPSGHPEAAHGRLKAVTPPPRGPPSAVSRRQSRFPSSGRHPAMPAKLYSCSPSHGAHFQLCMSLFARFPFCMFGTLTTFATTAPPNTSFPS